MTTELECRDSRVGEAYEMTKERNRRIRWRMRRERRIERQVEKDAGWYTRLRDAIPIIIVSYSLPLYTFQVQTWGRGLGSVI